MGTILAILQWAIPSGGIGAAIAWLANRKSRKSREAQAAKDVHDTFKAMYDDVSSLLEKTQKKYEEIQAQLEKISTENCNLKRVVNGLKKAIQAIQTCPHNMQCPVRDELSVNPNGDDNGSGTKGQRGAKNDGVGEGDDRNRAASNRHGITGSDTVATGKPTGGGDVYAGAKNDAGNNQKNQ